jgi:hypothetical protein
MPVKNAFLAGVLAHVPEAERGKAEAELITLEEGGLRQADYSKLSAEAQAAKQKFDDLYTKNTDWYTQRQADLQELDTLRAKVATVDPTVVVPKPAALPDNMITKEELRKQMDEQERGAVGFIAQANRLQLQHFKEFGEILDLNDLLADKQVQQIGLNGVYQLKFKEQIAAKVKAADDARAEAFRKEGREAAFKELAGKSTQYPVLGNEASSLDAIEAARLSGDGKVTLKSLDDMASEYARLNASRMGGGTSGP